MAKHLLPPDDMSPQINELDLSDDEPGLREFVGFIFQNWLGISFVTLFVFLAGLSYAFLATPIYQADALVQIEDRDAKSKNLSDITSLFSGGDITADAEIEILRSRFLIGKVVDDLSLEIRANPVRFPILGGFIARRYDLDQPSPALFGLNSYAWGGEEIRVQHLQVAEDLLGVPLKLTMGSDQDFTLFDPDGRFLLEGRVGQMATADKASVLITTLRGRPETTFQLIRMPRQHVLLSLQRDLQISEKGRKTGILSVTLRGADPQEAANIVNSLIDNYLSQNIRRRSEENQKMLEFLNTQAPRIQSELAQSESALGDYRSKTGTLGMSLEAKSFVEASAQLEQQIAMLRLQKADLEQRFTANHPALTAVNNKLGQLNAEKQKLLRQIRNIPETELEAVRLERNTKIASDIYIMLLNKVQELSVAKAGTIGNVRILDPAERPRLAIEPKKPVLAALSFLLGISLGLGLSYLRVSLLKGVEDPYEIERKLGIPIYCAVPQTHEQKVADKTIRKGLRSTALPFLLAQAHPTDMAIESLRSLRTSIGFATMETGNNVIMITGPALGVGKSFVCANLAATIAETGKRVLLLDADMRKGYLHTTFGTKRSPGLSNLISEQVPLDQCLRQHTFSSMDFIPAGTRPPNPSELLMSDHFTSIINELSSSYDFVIIDTPPVLAVTDPGIVGKAAAVCFLVVAYGQHHIREIELTSKRLKQAGVKVHGIVFNKIPKAGMGYGYGRYYGYHYQYNYK